MKCWPQNWGEEKALMLNMLIIQLDSSRAIKCAC